METNMQLSDKGSLNDSEPIQARKEERTTHDVRIELDDLRQLESELEEQRQANRNGYDWDCDANLESCRAEIRELESLLDDEDDEDDYEGMPGLEGEVEMSDLDSNPDSEDSAAEMDEEDLYDAALREISVGRLMFLIAETETNINVLQQNAFFYESIGRNPSRFYDAMLVAKAMRVTYNNELIRRELREMVERVDDEMTRQDVE
jgi:hypothetical protein